VPSFKRTTASDAFEVSKLMKEESYGEVVGVALAEGSEAKVLTK
jgi:hypothetical protein